MKRADDHYGNTARKIAPVDDLPLFANEPAPAEPPTHLVPVRAHLRRVPGGAPPSGAELRDSALAAHEADEAKREAIEYVRAELATLYGERVRSAVLFPEEGIVAGVTADDVDAILHRWSACPRVLHEIPGLWKGAVFRSGWEMTGQRIRSSRPHMRATELPVWRPRTESARKAS